ncbi:hypothetical protein GCM10027431_09610 [Lysobacter rhizosphaerae]
MTSPARKSAGNPRYTLLDRWFLLAKACCDSDLSRGDVAVLCVLLNHVDPMGQAYPGPSRIAAHANLDRRTVKRCVTRLERHGYLEVERPGQRTRNSYWPVFVSGGVQPKADVARRSLLDDALIPF